MRIPPSRPDDNVSPQAPCASRYNSDIPQPDFFVGWFRFQAADWAEITRWMVDFCHPWSFEATLFDLRYWAGLERIGRAHRPGRRALARRWQTTEKRARGLLEHPERWADSTKPAPSPHLLRRRLDPRRLVRGLRGAAHRPVPGWERMEAWWWAPLADAFTRRCAPWPMAAAAMDLRFWESQEALGAHPRPAGILLAARWHWTLETVQALLDAPARWSVAPAPRPAPAPEGPTEGPLRARPSHKPPESQAQFPLHVHDPRSSNEPPNPPPGGLSPGRLVGSPSSERSEELPATPAETPRANCALRQRQAERRQLGQAQLERALQRAVEEDIAGGHSVDVADLKNPSPALLGGIRRWAKGRGLTARIRDLREALMHLDFEALERCRRGEAPAPPARVWEELSDKQRRAVQVAWAERRDMDPALLADFQPYAAGSAMLLDELECLALQIYDPGRWELLQRTTYPLVGRPGWG